MKFNTPRLRTGWPFVSQYVRKSAPTEISGDPPLRGKERKIALK
jgi:hypothetical protein